MEDSAAEEAEEGEGGDGEEPDDAVAEAGGGDDEDGADRASPGTCVLWNNDQRPPPVDRARGHGESPPKAQDSHHQPPRI
eukprot:4101145-Pyramimonas_sp.AAC.1